MTTAGLPTAGQQTGSRQTDVAAIIDLINTKTTTQRGLSVEFQGLVAQDGVKLEKEVTQSQPVVSYSASPAKWYTFIMIDPDAPSSINISLAPWLHWLQRNSSVDGYGDGIVPYFGPAPPIGTGVHRYLFLLYEQTGGYDDVKKNDFKILRREQFSFLDYVKAKQLLLKNATYFTVVG